MINVLINRLQLNEAITSEERERRTGNLYKCWGKNYEKLMDLNWQIIRSQEINLQIYFKRLKIYQQIKYIFEGKKPPSKAERAKSDNESMEDIFGIDKFINGVIAECCSRYFNPDNNTLAIKPVAR